jgi:CBS domain-containing protein
VLNGDVIHMEGDGVPAADLMTDGVITVTTDTGVEDAVDTLLAEDIGSLIVVDEDHRLAGVVTSNDFLEVIARGDVDDGATVERYMTDQVVTVGPDETIQDAAARMITNGISHLPVEDADGEIIGMLSTTDITAYSVSNVR